MGSSRFFCSVVFLGSLLFTGAQAQQAEPQAQMDYSRCNPRPDAPFGFTMEPNLDENGRLNLQNRQKLKSYSREANREKATLENPFGLGDVSLELEREPGANGRPKSLWWGTGRNMAGQASTEMTFMYEGNRCYVDRVIHRSGQSPNGGSITYDRAMCNELLEAVKKIGSKQWERCLSEMNKFNAILQRHKERLKKENLNVMWNSPTELGDGWPKLDETTSAFFTTHSCLMTKRAYEGAPGLEDLRIMPTGFGAAFPPANDSSVAPSSGSAN